MQSTKIFLSTQRFAPALLGQPETWNCISRKKVPTLLVICLWFLCYILGEYEYESYDGWYNNPAHPDWGGAGRRVKIAILIKAWCSVLEPDMPLERKVPIHYLDGVFDLSGYDRPNVLVISNLTFEGLTGRGSDTRTALFTFYGKNSYNSAF